MSLLQSDQTLYLEYQLFRFFKIRPHIFLHPFKKVIVIPALAHVKQTGQQSSVIPRQNFIADKLKTDNPNQSSMGMRHYAPMGQQRCHA